jgi:hypothetical protein
MDSLDMMDDGNLRDEIYANMQLKTTAELLKIWEENDRDEWTPLAFDVVKEILFHRTGAVPDIPAFHKNAKKLSKNITSLKFPKNRLIRTTTIAYFILFFILIIFSPKGENGQNNIIVYPCLLGVAVCLFITMAVYTYYAWTLDSKSFREWGEDQSLFTPDWSIKWSRALVPDWFVLWNMRLIGPLGLLLALHFLAWR